MLLFCSSTTALGNVLLGDLLPKFFAPMVLHLLDFLPCQRKLTEGLSDLQIEPEGAPSHALRSPHNPSGTACHLPLHRGGWEILLCAASTYIRGGSRFCKIVPLEDTLNGSLV